MPKAVRLCVNVTYNRINSKFRVFDLILKCDDNQNQLNEFGQNKCCPRTAM